MTFLELCKRLRQECGISGDGPAAVTGQVGRYKQVVDWVNSAYMDIQNKWMDWFFLWSEGTITLVEGQRDYNPPSNSRMLNEDSFYLDGEKLEPIKWDAYRRERDSWDDQTGTPDNFTILPNGKVRFFPTPDAEIAAENVNVEFQVGGVEMTGNTDQPLIPVPYHDTIWKRAKWYWAVFSEAEMEASGANLLYQEALKRLEANQLPSIEYAHGRIQGADIVVRAE